MRSTICLAVLLAALSASLAVPSCRVPPPTTGVGKIISCGTDAVRSCGPMTLPAVNTCLAGDGDVTSCLLGLIRPATCVTEEVVACLVRHEGAEFAHAAQANPDDVRSFRCADRAKTFLEQRRYVFQDDPGSRAPAAPSVP